VNLSAVKPDPRYLLDQAVGNFMALSWLRPERFEAKLLDVVTDEVLGNLSEPYRRLAGLAVYEVMDHGVLNRNLIRKKMGKELWNLTESLSDNVREMEPQEAIEEIGAALDLILGPMIPPVQVEKKTVAPKATAQTTEPVGDTGVVPLDGPKKSTAPTAADVAEGYLEARGETLKFWRGAFYRWVGTHYQEIPASDLTASVISFLQEVSRKAAGARAAGEVIANVKALIFVPSDVDPPSFLTPNGPVPASGDLIPMANGIFDVGKFIAGKEDVVTPSSPDLFALHSLPNPFIPDAKCQNFERIMKENLPDPEHRALVQEWMGLNLTPVTDLEAFMIYHGEAATGKTVLCTVLSTMLGPANVSELSLEAFDPRRTFPLAALVGKLANITDDLSECDKTSEGLLKKLVTGFPVTIERKFGEPFSLKNRARFTFATNVLPRFTDRTEGVWRRMLILPFAQVVPKENREGRFLDPEWWIRSGELPGIFLWAVEGLRRLRARGRFEMPADCQKACDEYKRDSNPAGTFLLDNVKADLPATTPSPALYRAYAVHVKAHGHHPLSEPLFAREVKRLFPLAEKTENQVHQPDGMKVRVWMGIRFTGVYPKADLR